MIITIIFLFIGVAFSLPGIEEVLGIILIAVVCIEIAILAEVTAVDRIPVSHSRGTST